MVIDKKYCNNVFLSRVVNQVTEFAIKHTHQQYLLLQGREYRKVAGEVRKSDLRTCTNTYKISMAMPCSHMLYSLDSNAIALQKTDFYPHHWIDPLIIPCMATYAYYGVVPASLH